MYAVHKFTLGKRVCSFVADVCVYRNIRKRREKKNNNDNGPREWRRSNKHNHYKNGDRMYDEIVSINLPK